MNIGIFFPSPNKPQPWELLQLPISLAYIVSSAIRTGRKVTAEPISNWQQISERYRGRWRDFEYIGLQAYAFNRNSCLNLARIIREESPDCKIIAGGVQASNFPQQFLAGGDFDAVIRGEGEVAFSRLLREGLSESISSIPGVIKSDMNPSEYSIGEVPVCLDDLPIPAWQYYYADKTTRYRVGHLLTSRGCPFHCAQCPLISSRGTPIREYSIERVLAEIDELVHRYGVRELEFYDETFTLNRERIFSLCDHLSHRRVVPWRCYTRVQYLDEELINVMRRAGCCSIFLGIGSGSERLLGVLDYDHLLDQVRPIIQMVRKAGIEAIVSFSLGIPTETYADSLRTIRYALSLRASRILFQFCLPFPATRLWSSAQQSGRFLIDGYDGISGYRHLVYLPAGRSRLGLHALLFSARLLAKLGRAGN